MGEIVFERGSYKETVIHREPNIRVVACVDASNLKLYRVECGDAHKVAYDLTELMQKIAEFRAGGNQCVSSRK